MTKWNRNIGLYLYIYTFTIYLRSLLLKYACTNTHTFFHHFPCERILKVSGPVSWGSQGGAHIAHWLNAWTVFSPPCVWRMCIHTHTHTCVAGICPAEQNGWSADRQRHTVPLTVRDHTATRSSNRSGRDNTHMRENSAIPTHTEPIQLR